jgi:hypothetical protein
MACIKEQVALLNRQEPLFIPLKTKGIDVTAKQMLQEEYAVKPRKLSTVPLSLMNNVQEDKDVDGFRAGKRLAPASIPQVFIM